MPLNRRAKTKLRKYYSELFESVGEPRVRACCVESAPPEHLAPLWERIDQKLKAAACGCGLPFPPLLEGLTVLDLGCGCGMDCLFLSKLVGPSGRVIGVDLSKERLTAARRQLKSHSKRLELPRGNVELLQGYAEDLAAIGVEDESVDLVVSNCAINQSPAKELLFAEVFRVLKPGGELCFSDVFGDRRVPQELRDDKELVGECLAGAMYVEDFRRLLQTAGCSDHRVISRAPLLIEDEALSLRIGMVRFSALTVRGFRLDLEDRCENYGQVAYYNGSIPEHRRSFQLDEQHRFEEGLPVPICGNTARILSETRYAPHFRVLGDFSSHYGPFEHYGAAGGCGCGC